MGTLIDLLGALMVASLLMLMMISFQFQLQDTANRTLFAAQMLTHVQLACADLNRLLAFAGTNMNPDSTMVQAETGKLTFRTYWDFKNNVLTTSPRSIQLSLMPAPAVGKQLKIVQSGAPVYDMGNILWLDDLAFAYYRNDGTQVTTLPASTTDKKQIRSVDVKMTFRRDPPKINTTPLITKMQLKVYFMNAFLRQSVTAPSTFEGDHIHYEDDDDEGHHDDHD
jgi:hypothetical protein